VPRGFACGGREPSRFFGASRGDLGGTARIRKIV
jgi:hypothetical protein